MVYYHIFVCVDPDCARHCGVSESIIASDEFKTAGYVGAPATCSQRAVTTESKSPPTIVRCRCRREGKFCGALMKHLRSLEGVRANATFPEADEPQTDSSHAADDKPYPIRRKRI